MRSKALSPILGVLVACSSHPAPPLSDPTSLLRGAQGEASRSRPTDASSHPDAESDAGNTSGPIATEATKSEEETGDSEGEGEGEGEELDDDVETGSSTPTGKARPHPLDGWSRSKLEAALLGNPASLGSMSIGYPNAGAVFNAERMPEGDEWEVLHPANAWGTHETIAYLTACIAKVNAAFPQTPRMFIGDLGAKRGGHLAPHLSHQSGRDVDVGYYYLGGGHWYDRARADNLDRARTWAFVKSVIVDTDVEMIFMDRSVQRLLRSYAVSIGEDQGWIDEIFEISGGSHPIIRHVKGHATHIHVRFYNPVAQETGRRAYDLLLAHRLIEPPTRYVRYKVKKGDVLSRLARRFRTTERAIEAANGLKSSMLRAGRTYKIPQRGGVRAVPGPIAIPARRLPPEVPSRGVAAAP